MYSSAASVISLMRCTASLSPPAPAMRCARPWKRTTTVKQRAPWMPDEPTERQIYDRPLNSSSSAEAKCFTSSGT